MAENQTGSASRKGDPDRVAWRAVVEKPGVELNHPKSSIAATSCTVSRRSMPSDAAPISATRARPLKSCSNHMHN
jgi:hypothetical protein